MDITELKNDLPPGESAPARPPRASLDPKPSMPPVTPPSASPPPAAPPPAGPPPADVPPHSPPVQPPGYGQPAQNPQQSQPQYGAPPQPGPGYVQYGQIPPPKTGMPGWGWALIGCGALFFLMIVVGCLALAAIPLITANTQEAKAGEAKAALGTLKDRVRVYYVQNNNSLAGRNRVTDYIPQAAIELDGEYYPSTAYHINDQDRTAVTVTADGSAADSRPTVEYTFNAETGRALGFIVTPE